MTTSNIDLFTKLWIIGKHLIQWNCDFGILSLFIHIIYRIIIVYWQPYITTTILKSINCQKQKKKTNYTFENFVYKIVQIHFYVEAFDMHVNILQFKMSLYLYFIDWHFQRPYLP